MDIRGRGLKILSAYLVSPTSTEDWTAKVRSMVVEDAKVEGISRLLIKEGVGLNVIGIAMAEDANFQIH